MDGRKIPEWNPEMEYIGVRIPDKMQISTLINEARGSRTMAMFAESCGVSASTLSRAVNGKITKPMTVELIRSIAENAETGAPHLFERLARANGLMPKELYSDRKPSRDAERIGKRREDETRARNIIMTELLRRGYQIRVVDNRSTPIGRNGLLTLPIDFTIETDLGKGTVQWSFMTVPYTLEETADNNNRMPLNFYVKNAMRNMSGWFLADAWEPEDLEGRMLTFLFLDPAFYMMFEDWVIGPRVNTNISFVTLDMEKEQVNFEIHMIRRDGVEDKLVFAREDVIESADDVGDDEEDIWSVQPESVL